MRKPLASRSRATVALAVCLLNASITCIDYCDLARTIIAASCQCPPSGYVPRLLQMRMCFSLSDLLSFSFNSFSIFAGGIFIFPLLSPTLALHLKFTQPQLTTIVLLWDLLPDLTPSCS